MKSRHASAARFPPDLSRETPSRLRVYAVSAEPSLRQKTGSLSLRERAGVRGRVSAVTRCSSSHFIGEQTSERMPARRVRRPSPQPSPRGRGCRNAQQKAFP